MNRFKNGKVSPLIFIFGLIIMGSLLFTIISQKRQNDKLKVYNQDETVENLESTTEETLEISSFTVADDNAGFSVNIPDGWQKIKKNGYDNYIHSPSATSVGIEICDYEPYVNTYNESNIASEITSNGYSFVSFTKKTSSSYEVIYQDIKDSTYDYIDEVIWSKNNIVTLHFIVNDEYFSKMSPYLDSIYNSFKWHNDISIIPDYIYMTYMEYGDFEFGLPTDWTLGIENNTVYSTNTDNTAQMTLSVSENNSSLENVSGYELTSILQPTRSSGFMLQSFNAEQTKVTATAAYYNNEGINMVNKTYIYTNGVYQYNFQFDYVSGVLDDTYTDELMGYYREFYLKHNKEIFEKDSNNETDIATTTDSEEKTTEYVTEELTTVDVNSNLETTEE
ncbi:MAG: hypothetical protein ILA13_07450 [Eubacterium sp.]|nr:hypothetical protein [Eubacterium sp.]